MPRLTEPRNSFRCLRLMRGNETQMTPNEKRKHIHFLANLVIGTAIGCALLGASCTTSGPCDAGATRCDGNVLSECREDCGDVSCKTWWETTVCAAAQTCFAGSNIPALCVESTTPDSRCSDSNGHFCIGEAIAYCSLGYRTSTGSCGATDHCVEGNSGDAACVSPNTRHDPACAGGDGPVCKDNILIECKLGYAVATTSCASCSIARAAAQPRNCTGYLGTNCQVDGDCAKGLVCHVRPDTLRECSAPCAMSSSDSTSDAGAVVSAKDTCFAALTANGPGPSNYYVLPSATGPFGCIAGYCEWLPPF